MGEDSSGEAYGKAGDLTSRDDHQQQQQGGLSVIPAHSEGAPASARPSLKRGQEQGRAGFTSRVLRKARRLAAPALCTVSYRSEGSWLCQNPGNSVGNRAHVPVMP